MAPGLRELALSVLSDEPEGAQYAREILDQIYVPYNNTMLFERDGVRFSLWRGLEMVTIYLHTGEYTYCIMEDIPESWRAKD